MSALVQRGSAQGRSMALAITIALHVALVAGLLAMKVVESVSEHVDRIQLQPLKDDLVRIVRNKPIEPVLGSVAQIPQPIPNLPEFPVDDSIVATVVNLPQDVVTTELPVRVETTPAVPDTPLRYQAVRSSDDYYPPQAIRMAAEGAAIVRACVDAGGRLSASPTVVRTSRTSLLDAAAVKWASEALKFQPATQAGVAIAACKEFRVSFTLH